MWFFKKNNEADEKLKRIEEIEEQVEKESYFTVSVNEAGNISMDVHPGPNEATLTNLCTTIYLITRGKLNQEIYDYLSNANDEDAKHMIDLLNKIAIADQDLMEMSANSPIIQPYRVFEGKRF